jgi:hypothetical protein
MRKDICVIRDQDGREVYVETVSGSWTRVYRDGKRLRYYWHGVRVPWLVWEMFS